METSQPMTDRERAHWVALAHCEPLTIRMWERLLAFFGSAEAAWAAPQPALEAAGLTAVAASTLAQLRSSARPEHLLEKCAAEKIVCVTIRDATYPLLLREISDPPFVLFVRGTLLAEEPVCAVGVVGTRKPSSYGPTVLPPIVRDLVRAGITIVSGLAYGIDALAHETTIAEHGRTIAAIGSGIDAASVYPSRHRYLADRIVAEGGAVIAEYAPGTMGLTHHFPARNRIIAGLSRGVLVVEAPEKSGALITTDFAAQENREVFAIPSPINLLTSVGTNELLKNGATPVTSAADILDALAIELIAPKKTGAEIAAATNATERAILQALDDGALHVDGIVRRSALTIDVVTSSLALMELRGVVRTVGPMEYTVAK